MKEFVHEEVKVKILGKEYSVKELSLSQKIKIIGGISDFIRDIAKNAFFKKADDGKITFNFIDEISLAELNIDKIILNTLEILPELLALSILELVKPVLDLTNLSFSLRLSIFVLVSVSHLWNPI